MITGTVKFTTIDQIQKFVDATRKIPYDIDACHRNYVVDAKSLLGILSLSLGQEIKVVIHSDDTSAQGYINELCDEFK